MAPQLQIRSVATAGAVRHAIVALGFALVLGAPSVAAAQECRVLQLNGSTSYARAGGTIFPDSSALQSFTVEAWVYPKSSTGAALVADDGYDLFLYSSGGSVAGAGGTRSSPSSLVLYQWDAVRVNRWNHVAVVFHAPTREIRLYVNGILGNHDVVDATSLSSTNLLNFIVGAFRNSNGTTVGHFLGNIDQVRVSSDARYSGSFEPASVLVADSSTKGLFLFDEPPGWGTYFDASGNGHTLDGFGGATIAVVAECPPTHAVTITAGPSGAPNPVNSGGSASLTVTGSDSLGHTLSYLWTASCPGLPGNGTFNNSSSRTPNWTAPPNVTPSDVACTISVTAKDVLGASKTAQYLHTVKTHAIVLTQAPGGTPNPVTTGGAVAVSVAATDTMGHTVAYSWSSQCPGLPSAGMFADAASAATSWTAPPNLTGELVPCTLTVLMSDGVGLTRTESFTETVRSDTDGDGLPDDWEAGLGLSPASAIGDDGPDGDPDLDGHTNLTEFQNGTHPRGFFTRYFAEGATGAFFETSVALFNPNATAVHALLRYLKRGGTNVSHFLTVGGTTRATVTVKAIPGMEAAEFSTVIESDQAIVADRTMTWDGSGYGSHAETSVEAPSTTWYLAEGATHSGFELYYLIQNPNSTTVNVEVKYLRPTGEPIVKSYPVEANRRFNIRVNEQGSELASTDVSAVITADQPIIVERAMYLNTGGKLFGAGHESAGVTAPATEWFLAEGATGSYFDLYVLIANPTNTAAEVLVTFLLPGGESLTKPYTVAANARRTIGVDIADARLANTAVSTIVTSTNGVPIIVERAMWWPGPTWTTWAEAHNSAGLTSTGRTWALAEGEVGGPRNVETYVLIANRGAADTARVTLYFEDGTSTTQDFPLDANSRTNVPIKTRFSAADGRRFAIVVEALGTNPEIVVERAMYSNAGGATWAAGTNAVATKLQ